MRTYEFTDRAAADLTEICDYIARDKPSAALRFHGNVLHTCRHLCLFPRVGRPRLRLGRGIRSIVVDNYVLFYRVKPALIQIVRVISGYRDIEAEFRSDQS